MGPFRKAVEGDETRVIELVATDLKKMMSCDEALPLFLAMCFALVDMKKDAIDWVEEAVKWGFINYPYLNEYEPSFDNIRRESRFKKLMEKVRNEWESFEV